MQSVRRRLHLVKDQELPPGVFRSDDAPIRQTADDKPPVSEAEVKEFVSTAVPELRKEAITVLMKRAGAVEAEQNTEGRMAMDLQRDQQAAGRQSTTACLHQGRNAA